MKRRDLLRSIPAAAGALAIPGYALARPLSSIDRVHAAIDELRAALTEHYGLPLVDRSQLTASQGVVVLGALGHPHDDIRWFVQDGSPLLADDVTGTTAFADWQRERGRA